MILSHVECENQGGTGWIEIVESAGLAKSMIFMFVWKSEAKEVLTPFTFISLFSLIHAKVKPDTLLLNPTLLNVLTGELLNLAPVCIPPYCCLI